MKLQTDPYSKAMKNYVNKGVKQKYIYLNKLPNISVCNQTFFSPRKKVCFQTQILGNLFKYIHFCFTLLFT